MSVISTSRLFQSITNPDNAVHNADKGFIRGDFWLNLVQQRIFWLNEDDAGEADWVEWNTTCQARLFTIMG